MANAMHNLGDGDFVLVVTYTDKGAASAIEIDLDNVDGSGNALPHGVKWHLRRLKTRKTGGTGTYFATELWRDDPASPALGSDIEVQIDASDQDNAPTTFVDQQFEPPVTLWLRDRSLWVVPAPEAGADNDGIVEIHLSLGWE